MAKPRAIPFTPDPRFELRPALSACGCGALVLMQIFHFDTGWQVLPAPLTPCFGRPHYCAPREEQAI